MSKNRPKKGDVFYGEIEDSILAGFVMHVSKYFKAAMLVAFFDKTFPSAEEIDCLTIQGLEIVYDEQLPNYTTTSFFKGNDWTFLENCPKLLDEHPIPEMYYGNNVMIGDDEVRHIYREERVHYNPVIGMGYEAINIIVRRYFSRSKVE